MRKLEQFCQQMQYDKGSLLDQKYDDAIVGIDYTTTKFIYDMQKLQQIYRLNNKNATQNTISTQLDKQFFQRQNKPIYLQTMDKNQIISQLKVIDIIKRHK